MSRLLSHENYLFLHESAEAPSSVNKRSKLLVIGPLPPPLGGVALFIWNVYRTHSLRSRYEITVHRTGKERKDVGNLRQIFIELRRISRLLLYMKSYKHDLIHIHASSYWGFAYVSIYFILSRILSRNAKIVLHVHSGNFIKFYESLPLFLRHFVKLILERSDLVIVTSPVWIKKFKRHVSQKLVITYVTNGYDPDTFKIIEELEARRKLNLPLDKKIVLCVANFFPTKGHVYLIKAIEKLVHRRRDVLVVLVGEGPLKNGIEDLIRKRNLNEYFLVIGWVAPETLNLFYNASDVVVLPSLAEGLPIVLLEALGCGKPFIGTRVGGIPDIITSERYGLLCEPKDVDCLAEKILIAIDTKWDDSAIRKYASKYTWEAVSLRLLSICKVMLR